MRNQSQNTCNLRNLETLATRGTYSRIDMQSSVALAGAAVLAMASGTEAFAQSFAPASTPAVHSAKGLASCRQASGRMAPLSGLRMVAVDPVKQVSALPAIVRPSPQSLFAGIFSLCFLVT